MRKIQGLWGMGMLAACLAAVAAPAANLSLSFVNAEKFTDAGYSSRLPGDSGRAEVQRDIETHLLKLVERSLAADTTLKVEVLDIDLAGSFEPLSMRAGVDVRIMRDITYPRITLRYTLTRADKVVAGAQERLSNMGYLTPYNRYASGDRLRYEKALLDDWFETKIVGH